MWRPGQEEISRLTLFVVYCRKYCRTLQSLSRRGRRVGRESSRSGSLWIWSGSWAFCLAVYGFFCCFCTNSAKEDVSSLWDLWASPQDLLSQGKSCTLAACIMVLDRLGILKFVARHTLQILTERY